MINLGNTFYLYYMAIVERDEWHKLHIAKVNGWTLGVSGSQHVLGWMIIFPPEKIEGSLADLSDEEIVEFKKVARVGEDLLTKVFSPDWFNYVQTGNVVKDLHIHLQPRYSSQREFEGHMFNDIGWGRTVRHLRYEYLPPKEVVFKIVEALRNALKELDLKNLKIEILGD